MRIGRSVRLASISVGRGFAFGPSLAALVLGGAAFVSVGCDSGAATGPNEVVKVDETKAKANQDMIKNMYDSKKGAAKK